jgi:hypothetical protein
VYVSSSSYIHAGIDAAGGGAAGGGRNVCMYPPPHTYMQVSMLPVEALQVEAGMCCLDMCASPGSKTMQLLEAVASGVTSNGLV